MFYKRSSVFAILMVIFSMIHADKVKTNKCLTYDTEADNSCKISNVNVDSCEESDDKNRCTLKAGSNVTVSFDFVPKFNAESTYDHVNVALNGENHRIPRTPRGDCAFSACPLKAGKKGSVKFSLPFQNDFPEVRTIVYIDMGKSSKEFCCIQIPVEIKRE